MEFRVERDLLFENLSNVAQVIPTRHPERVLSNVLIHAEEGHCILKGTDFDKSIVAKINVEVIEQGACGTNARKLYELLRELPNGTLHIRAEKQFVILVEGNNAKYALPMVKEDEFPEIADHIEPDFTFTEKTENFISMHSKTSFIASNDVTMPAYTGIQWEIAEDGVNMVTTDGHRLALVKDKRETSVKEPLNILLPVNATDLISRLLSKSENEEFTVSGNKANLQCEIDNYIIITRLIIDKFPNYNAVMPKDNNKKLIIGRDDLMLGLRRAEILCSPLSHLVIIDTTNQAIMLKTSDDQTGSHLSEPLKGEFEGEEIIIGFNARDLMEIIRHIGSENVIMNFKGELTATIIEPEIHEENQEQLYLVMPLRVPKE